MSRRKGSQTHSPTQHSPMGRSLPGSSGKKPKPPDGKEAAAPAFEPGAEVEVRLDDDGFHGSWFEATIVSYHPGGRGAGPPRYKMYYSSLVSDDGGRLVEQVPATHVRPRPPPPPSPPDFSLHDIVEAFHNDGWWSGVIVSSNTTTTPPSCAVAFPITREVISFPLSLVRPRCDFVGGNWVPSREAMAIQRANVKTYTAGEKVEVSRNRETYGYSWFPAFVSKVVDRMSYLVEYDGLKEDGKALTEFLHSHFIRPAVEHFPYNEPFRPDPLAEVQVFRDGAWSPGVVLEAVGESEYVVRIEDSEEAELVVRCCATVLRPRFKWNGKSWKPASTKRLANLKRLSRSGKSSCPVDVASSDDDDSMRHPESHAKKRLRNKSIAEEALQPNRGIASTKDSGHAKKSEMDTPLQKLLSRNRPLRSCSALSIKKCPKVLSNRILTTSAAETEASFDPSLGQPIPPGRVDGVKKQSKVNLGNQSDTMLPDDHMNTSDYEANDGEARDIVPLAELKRRKLASPRMSNTFQQKGEEVQIQLEKRTNSSATKEIQCGFSTSVERKTCLVLEKQREEPDAVQIELGKVSYDRSNIGISPVLSNSKESAKQKNFKESHLLVNSSDHEAASTKAGRRVPIAGLKWKSTSCRTASTLQQKGRKKLTVLAPRRQKSSPNKIHLEKESRSSTVQHLERTSNYHLKRTGLPNQDLSQDLPLGFKLLCNEVAASDVNSTLSVNGNDTHECHADGICKANKQASSPEERMATMINDVSEVNHHLNLFEEGLTSTVADISIPKENSTDVHARSTSLLSSDCQVQNGRKTEERPIGPLPQNAKSIQHNSVDLPLEKENRSSIVQLLDSTSNNHLKGTVVPNQDLSQDLPLGFKPFCNEAAVSYVNTTSGVNAHDPHECGADGICEDNRQDIMPEDSIAATTNIISEVNQQLNLLEDGLTSTVAEINLLMENSANLHARNAGLLSPDCQVQDGRKAEESPIGPLPQNAQCMQQDSVDLPLEKSVESSMVPHSPSRPFSAKQLSFPKSSLMWAPIEAMEVFRKIPQQPHFLPLEQYLPSLREGIALGLIIQFANVEESIGKLHIEDSTALFEEKMSALAALEVNGFNVEVLRSRLNKLLQIKTSRTKYERNKEKLNEHILEKKASASRINALIDTKHEAILDLEQKLELLRVEKETLAKQKACEDAELSRLEMQGIEVHEECGNAERHFYDVLAEPW